MYAKKILFSLAVLALLLVIPTTASADGGDLTFITYPDCGSVSGPWYEILALDGTLIFGFGIGGMVFTSGNGWEIRKMEYIPFRATSADVYTYPAGTTSVITPSIPFEDAKLTLTKPCSTADAAPEFTGRYVYTLFGNYPCNLISSEENIPSRFLNPSYTAPLCEMPGQSHIWNGEWAKYKEMDLDGRLFGGPYYDTGIPEVQ